MTEFLWFIGGAFVYSLLSRLLRISYTAHLIREIQINVIQLLGSAVQDVAFIHALKYKLMSEAEFPEEYINTEKKVDEEDYTSWKSEVVQKLHSSVSPVISASLSFKNWEELVDILDRYYKNEK